MDELGHIPETTYETVYVPGLEALKSIVPVAALMFNPIGVAEKIPPEIPEIVGVGFRVLVQKDVEP